MCVERQTRHGKKKVVRLRITHRYSASEWSTAMAMFAKLKRGDDRCRDEATTARHTRPLEALEGKIRWDITVDRVLKDLEVAA